MVLAPMLRSGSAAMSHRSSPYGAAAYQQHASWKNAKQAYGYGPAAGYGYGAPAAMQMGASNKNCDKINCEDKNCDAKKDSHKAMYFCDDLSQWFAPETSGFRGLCVSRDIESSRYQDAFDHFLATYHGRGKIRNQLSLGECVDVKKIHAEGGDVRAEAAKAIAGLVQGLELPKDLIETIKSDAVELAETMSKLLPTHQHLHVKLESFGETSRCSVWHQDHYVARALVCYCGPGTEYIEDSNFNFPLWKDLLSKEGMKEEDNQRLLKDPADVKSVNCGNMLLIKGNKYPCKSGGLLHKSPETEYDEFGRAMFRLALKVDVKDGH